MAAFKFSILICTDRSFARLSTTLKALHEQASCFADAGEIVIVDNTSIGAVLTEGKSHFDQCDSGGSDVPVRWIHEGRRGKSNALNAGVRATNGEIIIFTDDDIVPTDGWLESILEPFGRGIDAVSGTIVFAPDLERDWMTYFHRRRLSELLPTDPSDNIRLVGANMAIRKSVLDTLGEFDPDLGPGASGFHEETLMTTKARDAGFQIGRAPSAIVTHYFDKARLSAAGMVSDSAKFGASDAVLAFKHHGHRAKFVSIRLPLQKLWLLIVLRLYVRRGQEGCPEWIMTIAQKMGYLSKMKELSSRSSS